MKNLNKILPLPIHLDEDSYLDDFWWGDRCGFWDGEWRNGHDSWSMWHVDPLVSINGRMIQVSQDIWDEVKEWSNTHKEGLVLHLNEADQALYLLIYGGI